ATRWRKKGQQPRAEGPVKEILNYLSAHKIGVIQLPCPEVTFSGNPRPPRTKDEYERLPGFSLHCERLAKTSAEYLKALTAMFREPRIQILAIVGIVHSPTCGVRSAPRGIGGKAEYVEEKGLFFEILEKELRNLGLKIPFIEIDLDRPADFGKQACDFSKCRDDCAHVEKPV
ncbi:MAG: hypothetical protein QXG97_07305, partial [Nitrososphaerota archaeon]